MPSPYPPWTAENSLVPISLHFRSSLTVISFVGLSCFSSIPDLCLDWSRFPTVLMYSLHFLVADPTECFAMTDYPLLQVHFRVRDHSTPMNSRSATASLRRTIFTSLLISKVTQGTFSTIRSSALQWTPFILVGCLPPYSPIGLGVGLPSMFQTSISSSGYNTYPHCCHRLRNWAYLGLQPETRPCPPRKGVRTRRGK